MFFCLFEALQCPFWKFGVLSFSSFTTKVFYSFLLVCIAFLPLTNNHVRVGKCFPLTVAMFIKFVLWASNTVVSNREGSIKVLIGTYISGIVYFDTHVNRCHQSSMAHRYYFYLKLISIISNRNWGTNCFKLSAHGQWFYIQNHQNWLWSFYLI